MTRVVPRQSPLPRRADIFDFEHANQKRAQLMCFSCDGLRSREPLRIAGKQLRVVMDHRGTGSGRADDRIGLALFEDLDEATGNRSRLVEVAGVEGWLRAARLSLVKFNLTTDAPQHLDAAHADAGPQLIDETSYEKRN